MRGMPLVQELQMESPGWQTGRGIPEGLLEEVSLAWRLADQRGSLVGKIMS